MGKSVGGEWGLDVIGSGVGEDGSEGDVWEGEMGDLEGEGGGRGRESMDAALGAWGNHGQGEREGGGSVESRDDPEAGDQCHTKDKGEPGSIKEIREDVHEPREERGPRSRRRERAPPLALPLCKRDERGSGDLGQSTVSGHQNENGHVPVAADPTSRAPHGIVSGSRQDARLCP